MVIYQNLIIGFQVTVIKVGDVFLGHSVLLAHTRRPVVVRQGPSIDRGTHNTPLCKSGQARLLVVSQTFYLHHSNRQSESTSEGASSCLMAHQHKITIQCHKCCQRASTQC